MTIATPKSGRRNLVISPIGDESMHGSWLSGGESRSFDVFLVHYGQTADYGRADADYYLARRGFKWELLSHVFAEHAQMIRRYEYVWCPDCDIRATTDEVNRLFGLAGTHSLHLAQPAIARGEITYAFLRPRPGVLLRYSPFVEVMCPLFSREGLRRVLPTFLESRSGWGIDLLWPRQFANHEMAIVDAVGVEHTGRLFRGENYQSLAKLGVNPGEELDRIIKQHGGFNRRLHRRLVRGRIKLPAVWEHPARLTLAERLLALAGITRKCA